MIVNRLIQYALVFMLAPSCAALQTIEETVHTDKRKRDNPATNQPLIKKARTHEIIAKNTATHPHNTGKTPSKKIYSTVASCAMSAAAFFVSAYGIFKMLQYWNAEPFPPAAGALQSISTPTHNNTPVNTESITTLNVMEKQNQQEQYSDSYASPFISSLKVNDQTDGYSCGDHALCNAAAISRIAQEHNNMITHKRINRAQKALFNKLCPFTNRSENNYLGTQQIYALAETMKIPNLFVCHTIGDIVLKQQETGNNKKKYNHVTMQKELNELFAGIKNRTTFGVFHFVYNQADIHWVLLSVVARENHDLIIYYADSFNQGIDFDEQTNIFAQKLVTAIQEGTWQTTVHNSENKEIIIL